MIAEHKARNEKAVALIAEEAATPSPRRHALRWARIHEINAHLKAVAAANPYKSRRRRVDPDIIPYYQTEEWKTLVAEALLLETIEGQQALDANWPICQDGEHFTYLDGNETLREGEVIWFDLDAETIHCTTWPLHDFSGYTKQPGARRPEIISVHQIYAGERKEEELETQRSLAAAVQALADQRERLPLLALQLY